MDLQITKNFQIGGKTYSHQETLSEEGLEAVDSTIPKGYTGELTTRTDNNTGVVTMEDEDHTISNGATVDVYWDGGQRRGMTVTGVTGAAVTIDLGSGENLPALNTTGVIVCEVVEIEVSFLGNNLAALMATADFTRCQIVLYGEDTNEGELTTRTDNDTGEITADSAGHTVATGDLVNVYWDGGERLAMTVGTVAGTTIPIDGGVGDNLPVVNSLVVVTVIADASVEQLAIHLEANQSYEWVDGVSTGENPLADERITSVRFSIADIVSDREARLSALIADS